MNSFFVKKLVPAVITSSSAAIGTFEYSMLFFVYWAIPCKQIINELWLQVD